MKIHFKKSRHSLRISWAATREFQDCKWLTEATHSDSWLIPILESLLVSDSWFTHIPDSIYSWHLAIKASPKFPTNSEFLTHAESQLPLNPYSPWLPTHSWLLTQPTDGFETVYAPHTCPLDSPCLSPLRNYATLTFFTLYFFSLFSRLSSLLK